MRHKYETRGIVLARTPLGEASALITLITPELGLVRALTQGVRQSGAKLAHALTTLSESSVVLVRGKEGWRLTGAVLEVAWCTRLARADARSLVGRVSGLLLRLAGGEDPNPDLFGVMAGLVRALESLPTEQYDATETLAALRILAALGLDTGNIPGALDAFTQALLEEVRHTRADYVMRINRGISVSGL